jgi:uncharacterized membrane protein
MINNCCTVAALVAALYAAVHTIASLEFIIYYMQYFCAIGESLTIVPNASIASKSPLCVMCMPTCVAVQHAHSRMHHIAKLQACSTVYTNKVV